MKSNEARQSFPTEINFPLAAATGLIFLLIQHATVHATLTARAERGTRVSRATFLKISPTFFCDDDLSVVAIFTRWLPIHAVLITTHGLSMVAVKRSCSRCQENRSTLASDDPSMLAAVETRFESTTFNLSVHSRGTRKLPYDHQHQLQCT